MISNQVRFILYERKNSFKTSGKEWALNASLRKTDSWTITTWESKPSDTIVETIKEIVLRSFLVYHNHLEIPAYNIEVLKDE